MGVEAIDRAWHARSTDVAVADRVQVEQVLGDVAALRRWLDGVEVACADRLGQLADACPSIFPEQITATATRTSLRRGARASERAATAGKVPELGAALSAGEVSGEHVDAVTSALGHLTPQQRAQLAERGARLAEAARRATPDEFRREVAKHVRQIEDDDGVARLERQKRAVRLRTWLDQQTGMVRFSGELDPETGLAFLGRLKNQVEAMFHDRTPELCPTDPLAKQDFLRAHA